MILKRLVVGPIGTNCYVLGSTSNHKAAIIDPGGDAGEIIDTIENNNLQPVCVLITHGHYDHVLKVGKIVREYDIPLKFSKKEYDSGIYSRKEADEWLKEGDYINIGDIHLNVLETPGHSPGALSYFSKDVKEYKGRDIDGIIFTGDLLFKGSVGRTDIQGSNQETLLSSIREKIMNNPEITDNYLVLPGHMGITTIGEERRKNMFSKYFA